VLDYQCPVCRRVFNAWTATVFEKTHRRPGELLRILRGIALATPTARLARELGCGRRELVRLRHRLGNQNWAWLAGRALTDQGATSPEAFPQVGGTRYGAP
jgi:hypothetical protein